MATIKEVAKLAGVSLITVSRVVNTPEKVAAETRKKVEAAMKELGYVANVTAQNLVAKRSGIICVYASHTFSRLDPFLSCFLVGVSEGLSERGYSMSLIHDVKQAQFCDGYIFSGHNYSETAFDECKKFGKPMALFGICDDENIDCIDTDNVKTARKIVSYLVENGHRKIAVVLNNIEADYVGQRYEGYAEALNKAGIAVDSSLVFTVENSIDGGGDAASMYLSAQKQASAVFLITDIMAVGFVLAMQAKGKKVPDDVSVVGFDGLGHQNLTEPKITTVVQPVYEISKLLASSILSRILDGRKERFCRLIEGEVKVEGSVKRIKE